MLAAAPWATIAPRQFSRCEIADFVGGGKQRRQDQNDRDVVLHTHTKAYSNSVLFPTYTSFLFCEDQHIVSLPGHGR
ncbi:hypothetical protein Cob_v007728 [Colletotrichum orbiculare MAFF 240422]|uniref:Uncharacterized protein n=1 Tax=Colletotrichum orbiculare (strain 104-T / ATCC 96160 / CBS 514.97 / LARS 414 / MAFF 240422) TaxID=1213857 RepID=A0A484FPA9_COLOR|nr:hypothetical protein Cob_v007728 [Colletotrichum orbiculare MAFF 240422]